MSGKEEVAKIYYFDKVHYPKALGMLQEFAGYVLSETSDDSPLTAEKLEELVEIYSTGCLVEGTTAKEAPEGAKCMHQLMKGPKEGEYCGKTAKKISEKDGLPKCSSHVGANPSNAGKSTKVASSSSSYDYKKGSTKGTTAPQELTTIQQAIKQHKEPIEINLIELDDEMGYEKSTNIVFRIRTGADGTPDPIAIGVLNIQEDEEGESIAEVDQLTAQDVYICYGNQWPWDHECVIDDGTAKFEIPMVISKNHPLVISGSDGASSKINSIVSNSD